MRAYRYRLASVLSSVVSTGEASSVLDAGCGTGYGAAVLSDLYGMYVGVDVTEARICQALRDFRRDNVLFALSDLCAAHWAPVFSMVVCFEVIEHVVEPRGMMKSLAGALASDGLLLASTPNRLVVNGYAHSDLHVREFSATELAELLGTCGLAAQVYYIVPSQDLQDVLAAARTFRKSSAFRAGRAAGRLLRWVPGPLRDATRWLLWRGIARRTPFSQTQMSGFPPPEWSFYLTPANDDVADHQYMMALCSKSSRILAVARDRVAHLAETVVDRAP